MCLPCECDVQQIRFFIVSMDETRNEMRRKFDSEISGQFDRFTLQSLELVYGGEDQVHFRMVNRTSVLPKKNIWTTICKLLL